MKSVLYCFSLVVLFLSSQASFAHQCLIVSGADHGDEKNSGIIHEIHPKHADHVGQLAGENCKYFDSWKDLMTYADGSSGGIPNIKAGESLIVGQIAHGDAGGIASTNSGKVSGEEILKDLNHLAQNRLVFSPIFSCYSGDLIQKKLIQDEINSKNPAIDNLCLLTGSAFNRGAEGGDQDIISVLELQNVFGKTPEDAFLMANEGMISSAPWGTSGIAAYFMGKQTSDAIKAIKSIKTFGASCPKHESALKSSQVLLTSEEDDFSRSLLSILESKLKHLVELPLKEVPEWIKLENDIEHAKVNIETYSRVLELPEYKDQKQEIETAVECLRFVLEKLLKLKVSQNTSLKIGDYAQIADELKRTTAFSKLMNMRGKTLPYVIFDSDLGRLGIDLNLNREMYPTYTIGPMELGFLERSKQFLAKLMDKTEWNEIWLSKMDGDHVVSFEDEKTPLRQKLLLAEILGESQLIQSDRDIHRPHDHLSPVKALYGFVRGGIVIPDELVSDPLDQRRRSACRKFKF